MTTPNPRRVARGGGVEVVPDALEGPTSSQRSRRALGDSGQLVLAQAPDHLVAELAARMHRQRDAFGREDGADLPQALVQLVHVRDEVGSDVRCRDHSSGPVADRRPGQPNALLHRAGTVVDPRQQVKVKVHGQHASRRRDGCGEGDRAVTVVLPYGERFSGGAARAGRTVAASDCRRGRRLSSAPVPAGGQAAQGKPDAIAPDRGGQVEARRARQRPRRRRSIRNSTVAPSETVKATQRRRSPIRTRLSLGGVVSAAAAGATTTISPRMVSGCRRRNN